MSNKQLLVTIAYLLIFGGFGLTIGYSLKTDQQQNINNKLRNEYDELKQNYDILEIQYKREIEDCYTQFGDYQDKVELGCYIESGWNCE